MKKKGYIILISVVLLGFIVGIFRFCYDRYQTNKFEKNVIGEYGFEISYPKSYKSVAKSGDEDNKILSNITTEVSGEVISEYMGNMNFVEIVRELQSEVNGIRLIVEAINIEKTSLTFEEICNRYAVMFKVYNDEKIIKETKNEKVIIDENEAGKVTIKVKGENEDSVVIAYLMSLEDKEITVTFVAPESVIEKNEDEINKIINSLNVY